VDRREGARHGHLQGTHRQSDHHWNLGAETRGRWLADRAHPLVVTPKDLVVSGRTYEFSAP